MSESMVYKFGEFRLDCGRFELLRGERRVKLERKPMDLLLLFTSRQGELVTRAEIAERLWTDDVFVDTEHGINTAVRKLRLLLRDDAGDPKYIETVTGRGYRFVAPVTTEAPPAMPEPGTLQPGTPQPGTPQPGTFQINQPPPAATAAPGVESPRPRPHPSARVWWVAAAVVAACAVIVLLAVRWRQPLPAPPVTSLAVLPLENLSGDAGQEYFADGMTDELTTMLARNSTLGIRSRTSVMQYKRAHQPLPVIARALGVDAVVEGSVVRKEGRVHLNLQLIRAGDDSHLWAQSYDQDAREVLLPEEAAQEIARQLHAARPDVVRPRGVDPAAHDAYLRGKYLWFSQNIDQSGAWFRKATEIQPDYAAAWAGLAEFYGAGVASGLLDPRVSLGPMEEATNRALQLDPNLAEAHQAMAGTYLIAKWDGPDANREIQRAIRLDPEIAESYFLQASVLSYLQQYDEAVAAARRSTELAAGQRPGALASVLILAHQYDAALDDLRLRLQGSPHDADLIFQTADAWRRKGNFQQYAEWYERWLVQVGDPASAAALRRAWQQGGTRAFLTEQIRQLNKWAGAHYVSPVLKASLHAQLGEKQVTLDLLEEGYRQHSTDLLWIVEDPAYDSLRTEPRFRALVQRTNR